MAANDINQRPNYFAGQYLLEDDFQLEQNYQIDREQRHNRLLHVSGIAEGLNVAPVKEGGLKVTVSPGTAVDKQGQQIILLNQRIVDLPGNGEFTLVIKYAENKDSLQEGTTDGYRRIVEKHDIDFAASDSSIALAKLTVTDGKITIDESVREYSGLRLPSAKDSQITLRSHGNGNPNLAFLTGSLRISGMLAVTSHTQLDDTLTVKGNTTIEKELAVKSILLGESGKGVTLRSHGDQNPNLAELAGSLIISGTLEVTDKTKLNNTLIVEEKTTLQKDLEVRGNFNVTGTSTLTDHVETKGRLTVTGPAQLSQTLTVKGETTIEKKLSVKGNLEADSCIVKSIQFTNIYGLLWGDRKILANSDLNSVANTDGLLIVWIDADQNSNRGSIQVYIELPVRSSSNPAWELRGLASVHYHTESENHIKLNSLTVPVKKNEKWHITQTDTSGKCRWNAYWFPLGNQN